MTGGRNKGGPVAEWVQEVREGTGVPVVAAETVTGPRPLEEVVVTDGVEESVGGEGHLRGRTEHREVGTVDHPPCQSLFQILSLPLPRVPVPQSGSSCVQGTTSLSFLPSCS